MSPSTAGIGTPPIRPTRDEVIVAFRAFGVEILKTSESRPAVHAGTRGGGTSQDGYDFTNAKPPEGHAEERPLGPDFADKTHGLVLHGRTGRGKSHLAIAPGTHAVEHGMNARFHQTAEPAPRPGKAKRDGTLDAKSKDPARADPPPGRVLPHTPLRINGTGSLHRIIAGSYERGGIILATDIESAGPSRRTREAPTSKQPQPIIRQHATNKP